MSFFSKFFRGRSSFFRFTLLGVNYSKAFLRVHYPTIPTTEPSKNALSAPSKNASNVFSSVGDNGEKQPSRVHQVTTSFEGCEQAGINPGVFNSAHGDTSGDGFVHTSNTTAPADFLNKRERILSGGAEGGNKIGGEVGSDTKDSDTSSAVVETACRGIIDLSIAGPPKSIVEKTVVPCGPGAEGVVSPAPRRRFTHRRTGSTSNNSGEHSALYPQTLKDLGVASPYQSTRVTRRTVGFAEQVGSLTEQVGSFSGQAGHSDQSGDGDARLGVFETLSVEQCQQATQQRLAPVPQSPDSSHSSGSRQNSLESPTGLSLVQKRSLATIHGTLPPTCGTPPTNPGTGTSPDTGSTSPESSTSPRIATSPTTPGAASSKSPATMPTIDTMSRNIVPITEAVQSFIKVDTVDGQDITLWYQTWGNPAGIPVLFVHGGPGNCVAHYKNVNEKFFNKDLFFVIEVDQRGTGKSTPTVQDLTIVDDPELGQLNVGVQNMRYYRGITIMQMSADFEVIRNSLGIKKWLVFGGSWGSTLGLDYAERYPQACIAVILRGIFLSTSDEMDDVFTLKGIEALAEKNQDERYVKEFNIFFEVVDREFKKQLCEGNTEFAGRPFAGSTPITPEMITRAKAMKAGSSATEDAKMEGQQQQQQCDLIGRCTPPSLLPNDARGMLQVYEHLITKGDREAIWKFFVFEVNLMAEDESELMDPSTINEDDYAEAQSVSFFESRLFLNGAYENKEVNLLQDVKKLSSGIGGSDESGHHIPTWVVQGTGDKVCPERHAKNLEEKLKEAGVLMNAYYVDAGHKASANGIRDKLIEVVKEFHEGYTRAS